MNTSLQFNNPSLLLLLWLIPVIIWVWLSLRKRSENKLKQFISSTMQETLRFPISKHKLSAQIALVAAGLALLIISVAGPFAGYKDQAITKRSHDIILLLDVSSSMTAKDVQPNRLENAKSIILELASQLPQDQLALMVFRSNSTLLCPLTYDRPFLYATTKLISTSSASTGETDIGTAITDAVKLFEDKSHNKRFIILFSDGEDLANNINSAIATAVTNNVTIFTIGIGKPEGSTIPDPIQPDKAYKHNGQTVITKLKEQTLRKIASETNGEYINYDNKHISPSDICSDYLRDIKTAETAKNIKNTRIYHYNWFLLPAFISFLCALVLSLEKRSRTSIKSLLFFFTFTATALISNNGFTENLSAETDIFNAAAAQFAKTNYTQSIITLDSIKTNNSTIIVRIDMAYGCAYFKSAQQRSNIREQYKLFKKAAESFQSVLKQDTNNKIAVHNLAISYKAMLVAKAKRDKSENIDKKTNDHTEQTTTDTRSKTDKSAESIVQKVDKPSATDTKRQNYELSDEEIEKVLSLILSREKEYQTKKHRYGKLTPLQSNIRDW